MILFFYLNEKEKIFWKKSRRNDNWKQKWKIRQNNEWERVYRKIKLEKMRVGQKENHRKKLEQS